MCDKNKYHNISLKNAVYDDLCKLALRNKVVRLSLAQTVEYLIEQEKERMTDEMKEQVFNGVIHEKEK